MRRFAISDIHGCSKTFSALLKKINLQTDDHLFLLGDYIDRGPDSKGVIDIILNLRNKNYAVSGLLGNHEWMLMNAAYDPGSMENWLIKNGGIFTLESYGISQIDYIKNLPEQHLDFYRTLQYFIELDEYYLVHAGFNFKEEDPFSDYHSMLWIRDWYRHIKPKLLNGKKIVHGHTPRNVTGLQKDIANKLKVLGIDCGCIYNDKINFGNLCALNLDDMNLTVQQNIEKE